MINLIKELYARKRKEESMKNQLKHYIGSITRFEVECLCEIDESLKEELSADIKQFYNCLRNLEKEIGMPKKIIYTKFIDKKRVLISEYEAMKEECPLDFYSPKELLYSIKKREIIEKKLGLLAIK